MPVREAKKEAERETNRDEICFRNLPPRKAEEATGGKRRHLCEEGERSSQAKGRSCAKDRREDAVERRDPEAGRSLELMLGVILCEVTRSTVEFVSTPKAYSNVHVKSTFAVV